MGGLTRKKVRHFDHCRLNLKKKQLNYFHKDFINKNISY